MENLDNRITDDQQEIKIEQYKAENKTAERGQVVFTGSSLMEMFPINKFLEEAGDKTIIHNRGVCGFTSRELLAAIDVCAIDLEPSKVFINIGTNDLSCPDISISQLIDVYDEIIAAIEQAVPNVKIYLMAYYPVNDEAATEETKERLEIRTNERIIAANEAVKKLARRHNQRYIDLNDNLKDDQGRLKSEYTIEGLHINESGYRAIFGDIMGFVKA